MEHEVREVSGRLAALKALEPIGEAGRVATDEVARLRSIRASSIRRRTLLDECLTDINDVATSLQVKSPSGLVAQRGGSVGLATADRDLVLMVETGDVDILTRDDGEAVYFRCSRQHHHHLVCRSCGYAIEITGPAAERWADALAERHGYADISHTLEVFGLCPDCSPAFPATH